MTGINTQRFDIKFTDSAGAEWFITIDYQRGNKRAIPVSFTIRGHEGIELTQRAIREIPFTKMAWASRSAPIAERRELVLRTKEFREENLRRPHRGSSRLTHEEVELTIKVFMDAYTSGRALSRTVATRFGISESAANKRIIMLRKAELLPPSRRSDLKKSRD